MKNNRIYAVLVRIPFVIFLAALATSLSLPLSSSFFIYAFAQTQQNDALAYSNHDTNLELDDSPS
jgi:hypothetical protein